MTPDFQTLLESVPGLYMVLDPDLRIVAATDAYLAATFTCRADILGRFVFDVFPDNPTDADADAVHNSGASFRRVLESHVPDSMPLQRHDVRGPDGVWEVRYWSATNSPLLRPDGSLAYILHRVENVTDIVHLQQRGAEEALRQTEARLKATLLSIPDEVWIVDAAGRVVLVNDCVWEHLGVAPDRWDNIAAAIAELEVFLPNGEPRPPDQVPLNRALRGESLAAEEIVRHVKTGELHWREVTCAPTRAANGSITGAVAIVRDVTRRHQTEEALRKSEAKYRQLFESMQEAFFTAEVVADDAGAPVDFRVLDANPAFERITGLERAILIGRPITESLPGVDRHWIDVFGRVALTGEPARIEQYSTPLDRWYEAHSYSLRPGEFAVTFLDVTVRRTAQQALAEAVQRLSAHMDNSPLAIIEFDPQFRVTRWSKEAERVFGWSAGEIIGRAIAEMPWVHEDDVDAVRQVSLSMAEGRSARNVSINRNYRKDGSVVECEWYNSAIYDANGRLASILSQVLDITEKKRTEERLRQSQKLESVGLLAGGIAHDFNNLLTGILGNASLVVDDVDRDSAGRIREVIASAEKAANLTRQLLAYSGKGQFIVRDLDVSAAVQEIAGLVEFSIPKSVQLAVNVQRRLPIVRMDPGQLQQILMNLVINAGEAIGEGNPGRITVSTSMADIDRPFVDALGEDIAPGRYVLIEVADTGSGIDPEKQARIFDPFFTTKFTGRGLGLAAVAGIVRSQRGAITLQTAPGRGSAFRVFLPVTEKPVEEPPVSTRGTILVVDDEATVRDFIAAVLRRQRYRVLQATDGRDALALCAREAGVIDAAILDVVMPLMGANDLVPALKARRPEMRILLTSGYSEVEARRLCAAYPGARFIQKPYTAQQLAQAVDDLYR